MTRRWPGAKGMAELGRALSVEERVIEIVADILGLRRNEVTRDSVLRDLGADEFDLVEIELELQELYGIHLEPRRLRRIKTVGSLIETVEALVAQNRGKE